MANQEHSDEMQISSDQLYDRYVKYQEELRKYLSSSVPYDPDLEKMNNSVHRTLSRAEFVSFLDSLGEIRDEAVKSYVVGFQKHLQEIREGAEERLADTIAQVELERDIQELPPLFSRRLGKGGGWPMR